MNVGKYNSSNSVTQNVSYRQTADVYANSYSCARATIEICLTPFPPVEYCDKYFFLNFFKFLQIMERKGRIKNFSSRIESVSKIIKFKKKTRVPQVFRSQRNLAKSCSSLARGRHVSTNDGRITSTRVYIRGWFAQQNWAANWEGNELWAMWVRKTKATRTNARKRDGKGFRRDELIGLINEASRTFRPVDDSFVNYVPWNYIAMLVRRITMNRVS